MPATATETLLAADTELAGLGPAPFPLPLGPLAPVVAGAFRAMSKGDWAFCGPRGRVGAVLRGCTPARLVDPKAGARPYKLAPTSDAPGNRALHAVGSAIATGRPTLCILGAASVASGAFHEALNVATITGAPVVFVVVMQEITDDAPIGRQLVADPIALARAHGWQTHTPQPNEDSVYQAVTEAREARAPSLVCVRTPHR
jgi:TPP-dependent pyruvate/acetoin dehydrogenase alpha subunit